MVDDGSWRTPVFRQCIVSKIDDAIRQSGINTSHSSIAMENHVFQKSKIKDEYLGYAARLILYFREIIPKKSAGMGVPGQNQGTAPSVADVINALQSLTIQGTGEPLTMGGNQPGPMDAQQQFNSNHDNE